MINRFKLILWSTYGCLLSNYSNISNNSNDNNNWSWIDVETFQTKSLKWGLQKLQRHEQQQQRQQQRQQ